MIASVESMPADATRQGHAPGPVDAVLPGGARVPATVAGGWFMVVLPPGSPEPERFVGTTRSGEAVEAATR